MVDSFEVGNGPALEQLLAQARTAVERENWPLAEDRLRRVQRGRPRDLEVTRLLAQVLRERGRVEDAEALLVSAWRSAPDDAWEGKKELALELADLRLADARPAEAARALERVLAVEPHHWEALSLLGNAFFDSGHLVEAIHAYRESVSANPFEADTWWNLATAFERAGEPRAAADALEGWLGVVGEVPERAAVLADMERLRSLRQE